MESKSNVSICVELTLELSIAAVALNAEWHRRLANGQTKRELGRVPALCSKGSRNRGIEWERCRTSVRSKTECATKRRASALHRSRTNQLELNSTSTSQRQHSA